MMIQPKLNSPCGPPIMLQCVNEMVDELGVEPEMVRADDFGI